MSEVEQVVSSVSIALRKGKGGVSQKVSGDVLTNAESLKKLLEFDDGFRFLKPIIIPRLLGRQHSVTC